MSSPLPGVTSNVPYPQSPVLDEVQALICLVLNVIVPGVGTVAAGVLGGQKLFGRGLAQLLTVVLLGFGWFWGIYTGIQLLQNAVWKRKQPMAPAA